MEKNTFDSSPKNTTQPDVEFNKPIEENAIISEKSGRESITKEFPNDNRKSMKKRNTFLIFLFLTTLLISSLLYVYFFIYLSPNRILLRMYGKLFEAETFDYNTEFNLVFFQNLTQTERFSSNYKTLLEGSVDIKQIDSPKASTTLEVFSDKTSLGKLEIIAFGKEIYIKVHNSLASQILGFEKFSDQWIKVETKTLDTLYGMPLFENISITNEEKTQVYEIVKKNPPITILQKLPDDNMNGKSVYHFKVKIDQENLINIIAGITEASVNGELRDDTRKKLEELFSSLELEDSDLWVGKKDSYPYKIKTRLQYQLKNNQMPNLHISADATTSFDKFNEPKNLSIPSVTVQSQEIIDWINSHFELPEKTL